MLTSVLQARGVCAKLHLDRTAAGGVVLCSIRKMRQLARSGAGADLLVCQADRESSKVLLYRAAKAYGVPVVTGVRASIHEHQWKLCAKIYSYLDDPNLSCYDEVFHPEMSAVALRTSPRKCCAATTSRCDRETWIFKKIALEKPERNVSISPSALQ